MQLSSSLMRSRDLPPQSRDQLYPISWGAAGHVTGEEGHVTSLTSWRAACDISARSFGLPTIYERPISIVIVTSFLEFISTLQDAAVHGSLHTIFG